MKEKSTTEEKPITVISAPKKKTKAEKISMIVVFTVGPVLLAVILYLYGVFSFIGVRIFDGDRISGEIAIYVNDKVIIPSSATVKFNDGDENIMPVDEISSTTLEKIEFNDSDENSAINIGLASFAAKGGEKGIYSLDFMLDKEELYSLTGLNSVRHMKDDLHIRFNYNNKNWYYITKIRIVIKITSVENGLQLDIDADYFADNAERYKETDNIDRTVLLENFTVNN
ncbi:MAG TPA: hypothetical protein DD733_04935, partial [Clostridiales bacterium]|nr:hypothetical protein [Clostridiales bacterium]